MCNDVVVICLYSTNRNAFIKQMQRIQATITNNISAIDIERNKG